LIESSEEVGVIIPSHNRPRELERAIKSVLEQTHRPTQVIVIDDGSEPENLKEIENVCELTSVQLFSLKGVGHPGYARKMGVRKLSTKWIAFLDDDDYWEKNKIKNQLEIALRYDMSAIGTNAKLTSNGLPFFSMKTGSISKCNLSRLLRRNLIITSSVLVTRELLIQSNEFADSYNVRGAEDYATWLRIATLTDWHILGDALTVYSDFSPDSIRNWQDSTSQNTPYHAYLDFMDWSRVHRSKRYYCARALLKLFRIYLS